MNYAFEQRIRFIDCMLALYGHVGRSELMRFYGIGHATATRDIGYYLEKYPGNCVFNNQTKRYVKSESFSPAYD